MQRHPHVQWVFYEPTPAGLMVVCQVCSMQAGPTTPAGVHQFAAAHREHVSAAQGHYGAGDLVARATHALGFESCTPCERRRRLLNQMMPRVFPRR